MIAIVVIVVVATRIAPSSFGPAGYLFCPRCSSPSIAVVVFVAVATRIAPLLFGFAGYLFYPRCSSPSIAVVVVVAVGTRVAPSSFGSVGFRADVGTTSLVTSITLHQTSTRVGSY